MRNRICIRANIHTHAVQPKPAQITDDAAVVVRDRFYLVINEAVGVVVDASGHVRRRESRAELDSAHAADAEYH